MVVWGEKITVYTTEAETFTVQTDQSTAEGVINSDLLGAVSSTDGDVAIDDSLLLIIRRTRRTTKR